LPGTGNQTFGAALKLTIDETVFPETARNKIIRLFSQPVLCAAIVDPKEKPEDASCPALSFRAAALANLAIRPLINEASSKKTMTAEKQEAIMDLSYEWKIGPLIWLPKKYFEEVLCKKLSG